jgi:hypothetical protein
VDAPIRALITLRDPGAAILEGPSASADVPVASPGPQEPVVTASLVGPCLEGPSTASSTADLLAREAPPAELTAVSSAVTPAEPIAISPAVASSSEDVAHLASSVTVRPSEGDAPPGADCSFIGYRHLFGTGMPFFFVITLVFLRSTLLTLFSFRT